jgi:hypothetical protein
LFLDIAKCGVSLSGVTPLFGIVFLLWLRRLSFLRGLYKALLILCQK